MRRAAVVAGGVLAIAAGVWAWQSATDGQVCERFVGTAIRYPTAEDALASLGVVLTDETSPEFGATLSPRDHSAPVGAEWRDYDIWKDGVVVGSVTLTHSRRGWGVDWYTGVLPDLLAGEFFGWPDARRRCSPSSSASRGSVTAYAAFDAADHRAARALVRVGARS